MLISLICEHYQLLKNRAGSEGNPEEKVMSLLESIFCVSKKEFFSEIFLNPFLIFEKQYLLACHPFCFSYAVDFLSLASQEMLPALE